MPNAGIAIEFDLPVEILFLVFLMSYSFPEIIGAKNMLLLIDREDIEEMDRFLEDNIKFGIDDMEERFIEYCEYIRQYEDEALPQDWVTAKSLFMSILSYGQDTWS